MSTPLDRWPAMSMPISPRARTACGRTMEGTEPAEDTRTPSGASDRAMPSAIWLRAELATQRNRMCLGRSARRIPASIIHSGGTPLPPS